MAAKFSSAAAARGVIASRFDARRLRTADFDAVFREGTRRSAPHFLVLARPNGLACTCFGISVRTVLGGAVLRNRIKRRVRTILRRARQRLPAGWDVVVQARTERVARDNFALLEDELTRLLASVAH